MSVSNLISRCKAEGISMELAGDQLRVNTPKGASLQDLIQEVRAARDEIIQYLKYSFGEDDELKPLSSESASYVTSHGQRRLWIHEKINTGPAAYNIARAYFIAGKINRPALESAFSSLLQRHEILRTTFIEEGAEPRQHIWPAASFNFRIKYEDYRQQTGLADKIRALVEEEAAAAFDLEKGPLLTVKLVQLEDEKHLFLLTIHHIICDGVSMQVINRELFILYDAFSNGLANPLPELHIQYKDYACWQERLLKSERIRQQKEYWLTQYAGEIPVLELAADHPRPNRRTSKGATLAFSLGPALSRQFRELGNQHSTSLFITFLATVNALLYRYTGQADIITGTAIDGRPHMHLEGQIGFYVNLLPLRTSFEGSDTIGTLLEKVKQTTIAAYDNQLYPFDCLVNDLDASKDASRSPIFDVLVSASNAQHTDNIDKSTESIGEIELESFNRGAGTINFDLTFNLHTADEELSVAIGYNTALYSVARMERMKAHYLQLLTSVFRDNPSLDNIKYLPKEEVKLLGSFNETKTAFPENATLQSLFEEQAEQRPDCVAIIYEQGVINFRQLNEYANQLAHCIQERFEVKPGDYVAVLMNRSVNMIVAILATLKAGAAYMPIEPDYPSERMRYMLDDAAVKCVIAYNGAIISKHKLETYPCIALEEEQQAIAAYPIHNLPPSGTARSLAGLFYTSGSTGIPKGVMLEHKGLVNRIHWLWHKYGFSSADVYLQKTAFVFDVSIGEIFMPLCYGCKLVVLNNSSIHTMDGIVNAINGYHVTTVHFSPTQMNLFLDFISAEDVAKLGSLKRVLSSGEALLPHTVGKYYEKLSTPLYNLYGPTEASIEVSYYDTRPNDTVVPIGKPISNVKLFVLGRHNELMPVGVYGEIGIGGVALARGYLNKPEQTAERFIKDIHSGDPNGRIYKTGDIGRWLQNGEIEFAGRKDNQVSIGGYRIELNEIENALMQHPSLQDAVVKVHQDGADSHMIAAYLVQKKQAADIAEEQPAPELSFTAADEALIRSVNQTDTVIRRGTMQSLFEQQVQLHPDAVAVMFGSTQLTYKELNSRANQLAHYLQKNYSIQPDQLVGMMMERSEAMIIVLLGILKSGAAYVPIDADYPADRIRFIMEDSGIRLLIAGHAGLMKDIEVVTDHFSLQDAMPAIVQCPDVNPVPQAGPSNLAYVIYTSGSTGRPKGVLVEHAGVLNITEGWRMAYGLDSFPVRQLQVASLSFDVFTGDVCRSLLTGGTMVICPSHAILMTEELYSLVQQYRINIVEATPAVILPLMDYVYEKSMDVSFMKLLIIGSDSILSEDFNRLVERFGKNMRIINSYGTTETTIDSSYYEAGPDGLQAGSYVPIGKPLANTKYYILDQQLSPLPVGVTGELFISGAGVARGYLNRDELTAERFLQDPFTPGARMYRTGDLARWTPDGNVLFAGRSDNQVKVRGYRIEPGEIENALATHETVKQAVVVAVTGSDGEKNLAAYFTAKEKISQAALREYLLQLLPAYMVPAQFIYLDQFPLTSNGKVDRKALPHVNSAAFNKKLAADMREYLAKKLPAYMIPSVFMLLEKMPLTVTGKIDRKALPDPSRNNETGNIYVGPGNDIEATFAGIWKAILKLDRISVVDDFFEMGGHSLKAMQILSAVYKQMGVKITLRDIYNHPTIRALAAIIAGKETGQGLVIKLNNHKAGNRNMFLVPPLIGSSTVFKKLCEHLCDAWNCFGLQLKGFDQDVPFDESIEAMAQTLAGEIKKIQAGSPYFITGFSMGALIAFELAKKMEACGDEVDLVLLDRNAGTSLGSIDMTNLDFTDLLKKELGSWVNAINVEDFARTERLVHNNISAINNYVLRDSIKGNIRALEAKGNASGANMHQWKKFTSGSFTHSFLPGSHYELLEEKNAAGLAEVFLKESKRNIN